MYYIQFYLLCLKCKSKQVIKSHKFRPHSLYSGARILPMIFLCLYCGRGFHLRVRVARGQRLRVYTRGTGELRVRVARGQRLRVCTRGSDELRVLVWPQ